MLYPLGHDPDWIAFEREEHEAMKSADNRNGPALATNNAATLQKWLETGGKACPYADLLMVIADCLDHIGNRHDMYIVIGSTRTLDSFTLNWKGDGALGPVYATDMVGLSMNSADLL